MAWLWRGHMDDLERSRNRARFWNRLSSGWNPESHFLRDRTGILRLKIYAFLRQYEQDFQTAQRIGNFGSGTGLELYTPIGIDISAINGKTTSIDVSDQMLQENQSLHRVQYDFETVKPQVDSEEPTVGLPFKDHSFDLICEFFLFRYIHDIEAYWTEVMRVLNHGGLYLSVDFTRIGQPGEIYREEDVHSFLKLFSSRQVQTDATTLAEFSYPENPSERDKLLALAVRKV